MDAVYAGGRPGSGMRVRERPKGFLRPPEKDAPEESGARDAGEAPPRVVKDH